MTIISVFAIAVALAMDAFAVSITTGIKLRAVSLSQALRMGGTFGGFQFLMPILGWLLGVRAQRYIEAYDHWLAFALLAFVGGKMLKEAWDARGGVETSQDCTELPFPVGETTASPPSGKPAFSDPTTGGPLLLLGVATSLDALAVGLSFALLGLDVWLPALVIGMVCFCITILGLHLGRMVCRLPGLGNLGAKANVFGGMVLLAIGLKILQEHGVFSS